MPSCPRSPHRTPALPYCTTSRAFPHAPAHPRLRNAPTKPTHAPLPLPLPRQGKELARQAATVINPTDHPAEEDPATHTQYVRSHGDFGPGEQRQRGYNWQAPGIDPAAYRFGAVDPNQVRDGVKQALTSGLDPEAQVGAGDGGKGGERDGEQGDGERGGSGDGGGGGGTGTVGPGGGDGRGQCRGAQENGCSCRVAGLCADVPAKVEVLCSSRLGAEHALRAGSAAADGLVGRHRKRGQ